MDNKDRERIELRFRENGVRPTAIRMLVYEALEKCSTSASVTELERELESIDKSTIFRALTTFGAHRLVHIITDVDGGQRYEICTSHHKGKPAEAVTSASVDVMEHECMNATPEGQKAAPCQQNASTTEPETRENTFVGEDDEHIHFYCEGCHRTICLRNILLPNVVLPEGFRPLSANFIIRGICPECAKKGM